MASGQTADILLAAFAHFLTLHDEGDHENMLKNLEEGQPVSFHFSKKIHRDDYAHDIAKMNKTAKKPKIQRKKAKALYSLPMVLDMEKLSANAQNHIETILKSGQHNIKISAIMRHDKLLTAKADIYYKAAHEDIIHEKPTAFAPPPSKIKNKAFKVIPKNEYCNLLAPHNEKIFNDTLIQQIIMPIKKGKDPP